MPETMTSNSVRELNVSGNSNVHVGDVYLTVAPIVDLITGMAQQIVADTDGLTDIPQGSDDSLGPARIVVDRVDLTTGRLVTCIFIELSNRCRSAISSPNPKRCWIQR